MSTVTTVTEHRPLRLTRRGRFVATVVGVAVAVGVLGAAGRADVDRMCAPVGADDPRFDMAIAAGYTGDPADGMEAVYAPGCVELTR